MSGEKELRGDWNRLILYALDQTLKDIWDAGIVPQQTVLAKRK